MTLSITGLAPPIPGPSFRPAQRRSGFADTLSGVTAAPGNRAAASALATTPAGRTHTIDEAAYARIQSLPATERLAEVRRQADAISASQGLPPGRYDYTNMSVGQMMVVRAHLVANGGPSAQSLAPMLSLGLQKADGGTSYGTAIDWTTPRNMASELKRDRDKLLAANNVESAGYYDLTLLAMKNSSVVDARNSRYFQSDA